jgi:hypothetical protein
MTNKPQIRKRLILQYFGTNDVGNFLDMKFISAPTLELAKMWFREVYDIHISIIIRTGTSKYRCRIDYKEKDDWKNSVAGIFDNHNQALSAGLKEAVKLI